MVIVDEQLKSKVRDALTRSLFSDPADIVDVSDGDDADDLHVVVVSRKLAPHRFRVRHDLIWDELMQRLSPEEWGKISLTIARTPDQVNGATIADIKTM